MVVVVETSLSKRVLFQGIPIVVKDGIMLVILPMLALMADQVYAYYHLEEEKLIFNKLERLAFLNIQVIALMVDYI